MRITATIELASGHHINSTYEREKKYRESAVSVNNLLALSRFRFCVRHFHSFFFFTGIIRWNIFRAHASAHNWFWAIKRWFVSRISLKMCLKHWNFVWIFVCSRKFQIMFGFFYIWHWYIENERHYRTSISKIFHHLTETNVQIVLLFYIRCERGFYLHGLLRLHVQSTLYFYIFDALILLWVLSWARIPFFYRQFWWM